MNNPPLDYENKNEEPKKHSVTGIISSVIFIVQAGILIPGMYLFRRLFGYGDFIALSFIFFLLLGLILGIISIRQKNRLKLFRYIGFWGNIIVLVWYIITFMYALSLGGM